MKNDLRERIARRIYRVVQRYNATLADNPWEADPHPEYMVSRYFCREAAEAILALAQPEPAVARAIGGKVCSHGHAVLVTHVDDGMPCDDYLVAKGAAPSPQEPEPEVDLWYEGYKAGVTDGEALALERHLNEAEPAVAGEPLAARVQDVVDLMEATGEPVGLVSLALMREIADGEAIAWRARLK